MGCGASQQDRQVDDYLTACKKGRTYDVIRMLTANPKLLTKTLWHGRTGLHAAAKKGHVKAVAVLLKARADPNAKDVALMTPLHLAAREGHVDVIKLLQVHGADGALTDGIGSTAKDHAHSMKHKRAVEVLLSPGRGGSQCLSGSRSGGLSPVQAAIDERKRQGKPPC
eukprot:TRINITY_DN833_c0_g1_i3.p1 TRINITY_DN833_c0_g1~~TRINITY_DN833_c0_g1_i3.p1  ORF type:complete len:168 (+),score=20.25 TRINITY_DN833_c0_g1_i3:170-673(+)